MNCGYTTSARKSLSRPIFLIDDDSGVGKNEVDLITAIAAFSRAIPWNRSQLLGASDACRVNE